MSVEIDPQELGFHRPLTAEVSEVLRIRNPNSYPVSFKVKTTAPKQPNSGRVEPGKEVEVSVILQAMKQEPPPDAKCRDKFLVQSTAITANKELLNLAAIWDGVDRTSICEKKIRVVYLPPVGAPADASHLETPVKPTANGTQATPDVAPPAYSSPGNYSNTQSDIKEGSENKREELAAAAAITTTQNSDLSPEELKQQLLQAEKVIAQLKQDQEGLRQRKTAGADKVSSKPAELAQATPAGTEGVPIKLAAILCFLSFMLAYLFF
ncbi:VAMP-associated protein [Daldinia sp. FL1419]|nr:VAMP-associated protein [Daldinia sp. FL1419]